MFSNSNAQETQAAQLDDSYTTPFDMPFDAEEVRVVEIVREPDSGLGISIVGGKGDAGGLAPKGIFIRHVLESSTAGRLGMLKAGDQILEVSSTVIVHKDSSRILEIRQIFLTFSLVFL